MFLKCRIDVVLDEKLYSDIDSLVNLTGEYLDFSSKTDLDFENSNSVLFLKTLPVNSVFCEDVKTGDKYICLPFFSSHITFSIKPCEHVWVYPYIENNTLVNGYWLSRPHGLNYTEDTTYTFSDRDRVLQYNYKNAADKKMPQESNIVEIFSNIYDSFKQQNITDNNQFLNFNNLNTHIQRHYPVKCQDLNIRGSTNNIINLGSHSNEMSAVNIVAGIGSRKRITNSFKDAYAVDSDDFLSLKKNYIDTTNEVGCINDTRIQSNLNLKFFANKDSLLPDGTKISSKTTNLSLLYDKKYDASKIELLELENNSNIQNHYFIDLSSASHSLTEDSKNLYENSKTSYKERTSVFEINETKSLPTTNVISDNINLISLEDGEINLSKFGSNIKLHQDNITMSAGKTIVSSANIFLGKDNLQSAVKGDTLKSVIEELIHVQKQTISIVSLTLKEIKNHNHQVISTSPIPVEGPAPGFFTTPFVLNSEVPLILSEYNRLEKETNSESEIVKQLSLINESLDKILSKITYIS
jgi:hypothetical protein